MRVGEYPATFACAACGHKHEGSEGYGHSYIRAWCSTCDCKQWKEVAA